MEERGGIVGPDSRGCTSRGHYCRLASLRHHEESCCCNSRLVLLDLKDHDHLSERREEPSAAALGISVGVWAKSLDYVLDGLAGSRRGCDPYRQRMWFTMLMMT